MKYLKFILLFALPLCMGMILTNNTNLPQSESIKTGIILDTMDNEVELKMKNGMPFQYVSHIFTPVCSTGVCLPVKVNIYWDLSGEYLRFDQPDGEILTKLDHVPFTPEDYELLHEILQGEDPRYDLIGGVKHSEGSSRKEDVSEGSSPSVAQGVKVFKTKYEMVDGITGSTLPEQKDKFVPGALYTTYTLWDLANSHQDDIYDYTIENLMPNYGPFFLAKKELGAQELALDYYVEQNSGDYAKENTYMSILDTTNGKIASLILNKYYYINYSLDTVQNTVERKFFKTNDETIQNHILMLWSNTEINDKILIRLSELTYNYESLMFQVVRVFEKDIYWTEPIANNLIASLDKIKDPKARKSLIELLENSKDKMSKQEWKDFKKAKKKS